MTTKGKPQNPNDHFVHKTPSTMYIDPHGPDKYGETRVKSGAECSGKRSGTTGNTMSRRLRVRRRWTLLDRPTGEGYIVCVCERVLRDLLVLVFMGNLPEAMNTNTVTTPVMYIWTAKVWVNRSPLLLLRNTCWRIMGVGEMAE